MNGTNPGFISALSGSQSITTGWLGAATQDVQFHIHIQLSGRLWSSAFSKQWFNIYFGEGNGTPLQYSCLENPMDGGAWWAAVHGVAKSPTWLKWLSSSILYLIKVLVFFFLNWSVDLLGDRIIDYSFDCGSQQTRKFLKRWEYQTTWTASWETRMQVKRQQLEMDVE